jgi:hypothetical protein
MLKNYLTKFISQSYAPKFVCISYDIPEIEIHGKKNFPEKECWEGGGTGRWEGSQRPVAN